MNTVILMTDGEKYAFPSDHEIHSRVIETLEGNTWLTITVANGSNVTLNPKHVVWVAAVEE